MPPKRSRASLASAGDAAGEPDPAPPSRRKSSRPSQLVVGGADAAPGAACRPAETSRRKQTKPHRVAAEEPLPIGPEDLLKVDQAPPARPEVRSTTSLIASLKGKREPKPRVVPRVECGVCNENVCQRTFERHAMTAHNGLARPMGESQEFTKGEKVSAFNRVIKAGLPLTCPLCKKSLTTGMGFFYHHTQCGKDIQPVKCPKCDWFFKPLSLPQHLRNHERKENPERRNTPTPRRAGRKAKESLAEGSDEDDPSFDPGAPNGDSKSAAGYSQPRSRPHPSQSARWKERLDADGSVACELPTCQFVGRSLDQMTAHFAQCPGRPSKWKVFNCDSCKKRTDTEQQMIRHVKSFHPFVAAGLPAPPPAAQSAAAPTRSRGVRGRAGTVTSDMGSDLTYFTPVERQADARTAAEGYWAAQPKSVALVWARVVPADWILCGDEELAIYSPPMKLSPAYKVQEIGAPDDLRSYQRMDTFTFEELDNGVLAYCGGPLTCCDWCPRPPGECQVLALSCLPAVDSALPPTQTHAQPAAVQVWSFIDDLRSCSLDYALCVDGGPVLDLVWCPVSVRSPIRENRLGSLAVACGDGRIRVYLMAAPCALPAAGSHAFYLKRPELRLEMFGDMGRSPCVRLDWAKSDGNRTVTGIFGNGTVVIWDITSTSALLSDRDGPTRVLYPIQVLPAHRGHGTAVVMSPASDRFLVSGGRDRTLQLWDREEPASVQRATNKLRPMLTDLCWPVATKKLVNAYDHSLFVGSPTVMMSDAALPVQDVPFFTHSAKVTSVSLSAPVNGLAVGSESGLVSLAQWRAMLSHKLKSELRRLLLKVVAERLTARATEDGEQLLGDQFMHCWETCGVTVWEAKLHPKTGMIKEGFDEHTSNLGNWVSNYPFMAINKVCWNRNPGTDNWLAVGMECGLLRVLSVPPGAFAAVRS